MDVIRVILSTLLSVASLFFIAKLMGHKQVAQLDFFDYISGITIGSVAAELATELETPWKPISHGSSGVCKVHSAPCYSHPLGTGIYRQVLLI